MDMTLTFRYIRSFHNFDFRRAIRRFCAIFNIRHHLSKIGVNAARRSFLNNFQNFAPKEN